jgi:hypothetical protein
VASVLAGWERCPCCAAHYYSGRKDGVAASFPSAEKRLCEHVQQVQVLVARRS